MDKPYTIQHGVPVFTTLTFKMKGGRTYRLVGAKVEEEYVNGKRTKRYFDDVKNDRGEYAWILRERLIAMIDEEEKNNTPKI